MACAAIRAITRAIARVPVTRVALDAGGRLNDTDGNSAMGFFTTKGSADALRAAGSLSTVGLAFVLALVIGFWLGATLDGWMGTKPVFTIVCFFLGLAAGVLNVYRIVSQAYPRGAPAPPPAAPPAGDGPDGPEMQGDD